MLYNVNENRKIIWLYLLSSMQSKIDSHMQQILIIQFMRYVQYIQEIRFFHIKTFRLFAVINFEVFCRLISNIVRPENRSALQDILIFSQMVLAEQSTLPVQQW